MGREREREGGREKEDEREREREREEYTSMHQDDIFVSALSNNKHLKPLLI